MDDSASVNSINRRRFMQAAAAAGLAATIPPSMGLATDRTNAGAASRPTSGVYFGNRQTRLTISMWDYSWLCGGGPGGAFADLESCVAGARERGFNTLRVDTFVSQQLEPETRFEQNWTGGLPQWGMTPATFSCNVRKRVAELARLCSKHELWLGLDSWKTAPDAAAITDDNLTEVLTAFGDLWVRALRGMRDDEVLERAVWVAPLNEVPWHGAKMPAVQKISRQPVREGLTQLEKTTQLDALYRKINDTIAAPIHAELAGDGIPLTYSSLGAEDYAARVSDLYDVVDIHFMPGVITDPVDAAALEHAGKGLSKFAHFSEYANADLKQFSSAWDAACRKHYRPMLERAYDYMTTGLEHLTLPSASDCRRLSASHLARATGRSPPM